MKRLFRYIKLLWVRLWSKTTIDEKAAATVKETGRRLKNMSVEIKDVGKELKQAVNQVDDIVDAAKGHKRKGRKPKKNG